MVIEHSKDLAALPTIVKPAAHDKANNRGLYDCHNLTYWEGKPDRLSGPAAGPPGWSQLPNAP